MAEFKDALSTIRNAAVDFSQLNVRSFVGTVEIDSSAAGDPDWDTLMKAALSSGSIKLVASTTLRIDGDADYFEDPERITEGLRAAHNDAVAAGQAARKAIVDLIAGRIVDLID